MGLMSEYIGKKLSSMDLEKELLRLIKEYNKYRNTYLLLMVSAVGKPIQDIALSQEDYYMVADILSNTNEIKKIDIYIETPGGSGEAAEEIVEFIRNKFDFVSFIVSGEAKSAGTIMVLSADEILMTQTGSLGPIDAQVRVGRSTISAYDYIEWIEEKHKEAQEKGKLNPFDATMIAQISPGELKGVNNALCFAKDLVAKWLKEYKFKHWNITKTRQITVDEEMKTKRADEIVSRLVNHTEWRSHGRSLKIEDLEEIGLEIKKVKDDTQLEDIVNRIQIVCRLLFGTTSVYKIFATEKEKIFKQANIVQPIQNVPKNNQDLQVVDVKTKCEKCGKEHKLYAKFKNNLQIIQDFHKKGYISFPKDNKIKCSCGFEINLLPIRNNIEIQTGLKVID
jgi:hypothetical protein